MSRLLLDPASGIANADEIFVSITSGEALKKGDLATIASDGLTYKALDPAVRGAALRPYFQAVTASNVQVIPAREIGTTGNAVGAINQVQCRVAADRVALAWMGQLSPYNINYAIIDNLGQTLASGIVEAGRSATDELAICVTPTGFAIAYRNAADEPKVAALGTDGTAQFAPKTLQAGTTGIISLAITALSNGNLAIVYRAYNGTVYEPRYAVVAADGSVVKTATVIATPSGNPTNLKTVAAITLTSGNWVAAFHHNGATAFQRFNAAGVAQGAAVYPSMQLGQNAFTHALPLKDGGFVLAGYSSTAAIACVYDAAGVLRGSQLTLGILNPYGGKLSLAELANGNWVAVWSASGIYARLYSAAGAALSNETLLTAAGFVGGSSADSWVSAAAVADQLFIAFAGNAGSGSTAYVTVAFADQNLALQGTTSLSDVTSTANANVCGITPFVQSAHGVSTPTYLVASAANNKVTIGIRARQVQRTLPVGVVTADAPPAGDCNVQITGQATLVSPWTQPVSIDANSSGGQRMVILGKTVLLYGLMATAKRNIS